MLAFLLIVFCGLIFFLAVPFFKVRHKELGVGLEVQDPADRWTNEKDRMLSLIRENDQALQENRIDSDEHKSVSQMLYKEAENALENARSHRSSHSPHRVGAYQTVLRPAVIGLAVVCGPLALVLSQYASRSNIDMSVSPHIDGRIPIADGTQLPPGSDIPLTDNGQPDVAQMVGRLEARIANGDGSREDYLMLLRSYGALNRGEDIATLLKEATNAFPTDLDFRMDYLRVSIDKDDKNNAELLEHTQSVLENAPGLEEARWYKGLLLSRLDRREEAATELRMLSQQLTPDHPIQPQIQQILELTDVIE